MAYRWVSGHAAACADRCREGCREPSIGQGGANPNSFCHPCPDGAAAKHSAQQHPGERHYDAEDSNSSPVDFCVFLFPVSFWQRTVACLEGCASWQSLPLVAPVGWPHTLRSAFAHGLFAGCTNDYSCRPANGGRECGLPHKNLSRGVASGRPTCYSLPTTPEIRA